MPITPENMKIYSKPSSINKKSLPRCILHWWINFLIILTCENVKNITVFVASRVLITISCFFNRHRFKKILCLSFMELFQFTQGHFLEHPVGTMMDPFKCVLTR